MDTKQPDTILLVKDDAIIALHEAGLLKRHGYKVITAHTSDGALQAVCSQTVDLILMDIDLGRRSADGTETVEAILQEHEIPIVFLTNHAEREMVEKVKGITRYGYVLKNSGEFVLVESINMAFELFKAHQDLAAKERDSRAVIDNIDDAVLRYDGQGRFIFFSPGPKGCSASGRKKSWASRARRQ